MKTSSAKAKGRRACAAVKELLLRWDLDLKPDDIEVTSSGATGEDLKLSPAARAVYNFSIEVKNVESLNVWKAFKQACSHVIGDRIPILFYTRNHSDMMVTLRAEDFMKLIR